MRITLKSARLAIGQLQFNKLPKREQISRIINPAAKRKSDTRYLQELIHNGIKK